MFSKKFYVDNINGSDGNDGLSMTNAKKTIAAAYDRCTANKHEAVIVMPSASSYSRAASLVWNKAYTHLIGLSGPGVYGGRCRISDSAAFAGILFSILSAGGIFKGIHWQRAFDSASGVENVTLGGSASYNYFEDCQVDGPIMSSLGAAAYRNLSLVDGARSNTFRRCTIGAWNQLATSTTGYQLYAAGTTNGNVGTHFMDCIFMWYGNSASITPIFVADLIVANAYILFDRCKFLGVGTVVNGLVAASQPANGKLIFMDCQSVGVAEYAAGTAGNIWVANGSAVSGELGGKAVAIA